MNHRQRVCYREVKSPVGPMFTVLFACVHVHEVVITAIEKSDWTSPARIEQRVRALIAREGLG